MMWFAGVLASASSITYPAISAYASQSADAEQQGLLQGILTGIRGLSNGFGPAVFGLLFYFFHVELDETVIDENNVPTDDANKFASMSMPGGPFLFGALLALLALLITMSLPEAAHIQKKIDMKKKTDIDNDLSDTGFVNQDLSPLLQDSIP